jgi:tight adherence protein C
MNWDRLQPLLPLLGTVVLLAAAAALLLFREAGDRDLAERLSRVRSGGPLQRDNPQRFRNVALNALHALGVALRARTLAPRDIQDFEGMLTAAGFNAARALPLLVVAKLAFLVVMPALAWLAAGWFELDGTQRIGAVAAGLLAGMMLPNTVLGMVRRPYLTKLRRGLPDALDLFVVCSNAGLGLESCVERVAKEMRRANRPIAIQFDLLGYEMRVLPERRDALQNFGERTGLEPFRRLAATLIQALRYGTPLSQALRTLAADMRQERLIRFEERTARLPALLVMPMAAFILPVLFIVLAGPSVQQLLAVLKGLH